MKGFVEITEYDTGRKMLFNVANIKFVYEHPDGTATIVLKVDTWTKNKKTLSTGFYTKESYAEVISKIKEAIE